MAAGRARPLVGCKVVRLLVFGLAMVVAISQAPSARAALLIDIPELNDVSPVCSFMALDALGDNNLFLGLGGTEAMMLAYNTVTGTTRTGILAGTSDLVGCSLGENNFAYVVSATGLVTQVDYFDFSEVRSDNSNQQLGTTFGPSTCFSAQDNYFFVLPSPPAPQANERFATGVGNILSASGTFNLNQLDAAEVFFNLDSLNRQYAATNGSPGTVVRFNDGITQNGPVTLDPGDDNITAVAYSEVERMAWFATSTTPGKIITFSLTGMTKVGLTYEPEIEGLGPLANGAWNQLNRTAYFTTVVEDVPLLLRFTYDIATQRLTFNGSQALSTSPDVVIFDDVNNAVLLTTPEGVSVVEAASEWLDPADAILSLLGSSEEDDLTTGLGVGAIFGIFVLAVVVILAATAAVFLVMRKRRIANGTDLKSRRASRRITRTPSQTELVESATPPGSGSMRGDPVGERFNSTSTNKPSRERLADSIYMGGDAEASWEEFEEGGGGGGGGSGGDVEEAWEDDGEEGWEGDDPNHRPPPQRQAPAPSERSTTMRAKPTRGHGSNAPRPVSRKPTPSRSTPSISTDPSSLRPRDTIGNPGAYDTTTASFPMKQFRAGTEGGGGSPGTPRGTWRPRDTMGDGTGTPRSTFTPRGTVSPADFGATMTMSIDPEKLRQMGDEAVAEFQSIRLPVINDDGWSAPPIVFVCVEWMMAKGLNEEGVFRIPASKTKINALLREFRSGRDNLNDVFDPHEVAGLLKLWVKSEQQLFPSALVPKLTAASEIPNADERKLDCFLQVLSQVPPGRIEVMHILVDLFVAISSNWKVNKMKVSNMAMVIAPTYFSGMRIGSANSTMGFLIKNRDGIFGGPYYE